MFSFFFFLGVFMPLDFCCLYIPCILFNALPFQMVMMMMIIKVIAYWFIHIKICIVITLFFRVFFYVFLICHQFMLYDG